MNYSFDVNDPPIEISFLCFNDNISLKLFLFTPSTKPKSNNFK
jgi:hypothetical protein